MKNVKFLVFSFFLFLCLAAICQNSKSKSEKYLKNAIHKSIKIYKKHYTRNVIDDAIYEIRIDTMDGIHAQFLISQISNLLDLNELNNKLVGYYCIDNKIAAIYSDTIYFEKLYKYYRVNKPDDTFKKEIERVYPDYPKLIDKITKWRWRESLWLVIEYKRNRIKIISKTF